jgi:hypothetical protein
MYTSLQRNAQGSPLFDRLVLSPDFYRQVLDDLTGVVLTPIGFIFVLAGLLDRQWRRYVFWFVAVAAVIAAMPVKFFKMNYYYVALLPPFCILAGLGWQVVCQRLQLTRRAIAVLLLIWLAFAIRFAYRPAFVTPEEDRAVVAAGLAAQQLTTPDEPIVTMHGDGIDLLYYCDRPGWGLSPNAANLHESLRDCQQQGARYLVVVSPALAKVAAHCGDALATAVPAIQGKGFAIYRLAGP